MKAPRWFRALPMPAPLAHVSRTAWQLAPRLFALGTIVAMGFAIAVGAFSAIDSVFSARGSWYSQGHLADLELRFGATDLRSLPDFGSIPGVAGYQIRMVYDSALVSGQGHTPTVTLEVISTVRPGRLPINNYTVLQGHPLGSRDAGGTVIESSLAKYHDLRVGSIINVRLGQQAVPLKVRGVVRDPEFLLAPANPSLFVPSKGSLGVLFVNPQLLRAHLGYTPANSVLFRLAHGAQTAQVRQAILDKATGRLTNPYIIAQNEQFSYRFLNRDLGAFRILLPVIVLVSALSAVFVTTFLLVQWVLRDRQTLGVFMAFGYRPGWLATAFGMLFGYLAVGAIGGGLLGSLLVGHSFIANLTSAIGLPAVQFAVTPGYVLLAGACVLAVFALAGGAAIRRVFALSPKAAMRYTTPSGRPPGTVGRFVSSAWRASWLQMPLRNLFRSRTVSLITIVSMAMGFGVTAAFFISYSSFVGTSLRDVNQSRWDLAIDFTAPQSQSVLREIASQPGVGAVVPYDKGVAQAVRNGTRANLYIGGFDPAVPWQSEVLLSGHQLSTADPAGMLLEHSVATQLHVKVGDALTISSAAGQLTMRVVGVFSGALPGQADLPIASFDRLFGMHGYTTGCFVRVRSGTTVARSGLENLPYVQQVLSKEQISAQILGASGQVTGILRIGAIISIAIAGLFVFTCIGYTVLQRKAEYQTLRLLGYSNLRLTAIIGTEVLTLGTAALALAVPVGLLTATYLNDRLSAAWFQVGTIVTGKDYLTTFVPALALLPLVALPIAWTVLRESLDTHLRTREIA